MELLRGFKPYTAIELAFAAAKASLLKPEIDCFREMHPDLLCYPRDPRIGTLASPFSPELATTREKSQRTQRISDDLRRQRYFRSRRP